VKLFQRSYKLVLGTQDVTGLNIRFRVEKTLAKNPNVAQVDIFNLSQELRESLEKAKHIPVRLEAGYGDELMLIYLGTMRSATSVTDGPTITTHVESGDGEKEISSSRIAVPIGPGTPTDVVLKTIAAALGVGPGNVGDVAKQLAAEGVSLFPSGGVLSGNAAKKLSDLCDSVGREWSIQDGNIQILKKGQPKSNTAFFISPDSGLVGSPSVDSKGVVTAQTLFIPGIKPGATVVFESRSVNGGFRVDKCTYTGETTQGARDWFIEIECHRLATASASKPASQAPTVRTAAEFSDFSNAKPVTLPSGSSEGLQQTIDALNQGLF
jgi:hypothetical protein